VNLLVVFLIGPVLILEDGHISVTFLRDKLKGLIRIIVDRLNTIPLIVFSSLLFWGGVEYVLYTKSAQVTRTLGVWYFPYWIIGMIVPVGMFFAIVFAVYLFFAKRPQQKKDGK
ncbi:unnamed protein product, partial [marine sediment metagenome]